jgi:hypothetical protein
MEPVNFYPHDDPDSFVGVACGVEGEVGMKMPFPKTASLMAAVFSSNPQAIVMTGEDRLSVNTGWTYDGETFSPPASE